jgi:hypothetical protein
MTPTEYSDRVTAAYVTGEIEYPDVVLLLASTQVEGNRV